MSDIEQRLITFLTRNAHLDYEIPDIAFHLKIDEKDIESTLSELYERGVVTLRQNKYGRTYWYYVPQRSSLPYETLKTTITEDLSMEDSISKAATSRPKESSVVAIILSVLSLLGLTSAIIWGGFELNRQIDPVVLELQERVKEDEFINVMQKAEKRIVRVETELKKTMVCVDSLKSVIKTLKVK